MTVRRLSEMAFKIKDETCFREWGKGLDFTQFEKRERRLRDHFFFDRAGTIYGAFVGERLVSSCEILEVSRAWSDSVSPVFGVASVVTSGEFRRNGYASILLERVKRELGWGESSHAYLYSEVDPSIYERLGFFSGNRENTYRCILTTASLGNPQIHVKRLEFKQAIEQIGFDNSWAIPVSIEHANWTLSRFQIYAELSKSPEPALFFYGCGDSLLGLAFDFKNHFESRKRRAWMMYFRGASRNETLAMLQCAFKDLAEISTSEIVCDVGESQAMQFLCPEALTHSFKNDSHFMSTDREILSKLPSRLCWL